MEITELKVGDEIKFRGSDQSKGSPPKFVGTVTAVGTYSLGNVIDVKMIAFKYKNLKTGREYKWIWPEETMLKFVNTTSQPKTNTTWFDELPERLTI